MRLGIISDAHHYLDTEGRSNTLSLLARQFEQWAGMFEEITVCAPLLPGLPPPTHSPYQAGNICLLPIEAGGGNALAAKVALAKKIPGWGKALQNLLRQVDAVHIRCPNNISILGLVLLEASRLPRQAVFTGSWNGHPNEPLTYRAQRLFLKHHFRGPVAVYGEWPGQPQHIIPSFSPSYSQADWEMETEQVQARLERLESSASLPRPVRLVTVGALNRNKNQELILRALSHLNEARLECTLEIFGDGPLRGELERRVREAGMEEQVRFHGNAAHPLVRQGYRRADLVVQAPYSEGFGKVPIEAFFHGVIPILSDVDMSAQIAGGDRRGRCFRQGDAEEIARHILQLTSRPQEMARLVKNGREYARTQTLEAWQEHLRRMLNKYWKTDLMVRRAGQII